MPVVFGPQREAPALGSPATRRRTGARRRGRLVKMEPPHRGEPMGTGSEVSGDPQWRRDMVERWRGSAKIPSTKMSGALNQMACAQVALRHYELTEWSRGEGARRRMAGGEEQRRQQWRPRGGASLSQQE